MWYVICGLLASRCRNRNSVDVRQSIRRSTTTPISRSAWLVPWFMFASRVSGGFGCLEHAQREGWVRLGGLYFGEDEDFFVFFLCTGVLPSRKAFPTLDMYTTGDAPRSEASEAGERPKATGLWTWNRRGKQLRTSSVSLNDMDGHPWRQMIKKYPAGLACPVPSN